MIATGGTALRSMVWPSEPSVATSSSWTILTTIWPGRDRLDDGGADRLLAHAIGEASDHVERRRRLPAARGAPRASRRRRRFSTAQPRPVSRSRMPPSFSDRLSNNAVVLCLPLQALRHRYRHTPRRRGLQYAAAPRFKPSGSGILDHPPSRVMTTYDALWRQNAQTMFQTLLRPRAHRAVGRWPPASRAGRRVEKNVFPRSAGVKPPEAAEVKENWAKLSWVSA